MKNNQPDAKDFAWEVIRRNPNYQADFKDLQKDPDADKFGSIGGNTYPSKWGYYATKWGLIRMKDPIKPWNQLVSSPIQLGLHDPQTVTLTRGSEIDTRQYPDLLFFKVDPWADIGSIQERIKDQIMMYRGERKQPRYNRRIGQRMDQLAFFDEVLKEKPTPTYLWFLKKHGPRSDSKRDTFTMAAILVEKPLLNPLRDISDDEINSYQHEHGLKGRKK